MCKYLQLGTTNLEKPSIYFLNYCKSKSYKKKFTEFQELNEEVRKNCSSVKSGNSSKALTNSRSMVHVLPLPALASIITA